MLTVTVPLPGIVHANELGQVCWPVLVPVPHVRLPPQVPSAIVPALTPITHPNFVGLEPTEVVIVNVSPGVKVSPEVSAVDPLETMME